MFAQLAGAALAVSQMNSQSPCVESAGCVQTGAAQLFALADALYARGDKAASAEILRALTQDKHPELRAEARFRLAAVLESLGDLNGAVRSLRDLLAEQPKANAARLELARILARLGKTGEAKVVLEQAEKLGLPPEVETNVRRFSANLSGPHRRGLTIELSAGPDSNMNRSTSSEFIDTIIAPFELDPNARRQSGIGYSGRLQAYSRDKLAGVNLLSEVAADADLYDKSRFNDVQVTMDSGPEFALGAIKSRAGAVYQRRWYGNRPYSKGLGANLQTTVPFSASMQLGLTGSLVRQTVAPDRGLDGWQAFADADLLKALRGNILGRISVRYGRLDANARPESLRQIGSGLLLAREAQRTTIFGEVDYSRTDGIEPIFLFGKTRHDQRWDFTGGLILNKVKMGGFSPVFRVTHSDSRSDILLYDYRRTRLDVGLSKTF